jgi:hypothetical protein
MEEKKFPPEFSKKKHVRCSIVLWQRSWCLESISTANIQGNNVFEEKWYLHPFWIWGAAICTELVHGLVQ